MKKIYTLILLNFLFLSVFSQIPATYYDNATGTGATLKTSLYNIILGHNAVSYTPGVWNALDDIDVDKYYENDDILLDIYSENPDGDDPYNFVFGTDQDAGSGGTSEGEKYNREHSFPQSWFAKASPMVSDLFHIYLTDKFVNGKRGNNPYGEVNSPSWTSLNGSKFGSCSVTGYSGTVFEPIDEFKGDLARTYFYMATRYENIIASWETNTTESNIVLDGTSYLCYETWFLNMLLDWNTQDPVSQKEIDRNDSIYKIQGNRNPYIDHPEYVNRVFDPTADIQQKRDAKITIFPNPITNGTVTISSGNNSEKQIVIYDLNGKIIKTDIFSTQNKEIDLTDLNSGVFFIKIIINNTIYHNKFIKN